MFDTAVTTATEALDKLHTTAESHHRIMILEVWGVMVAGLHYTADSRWCRRNLIPEIPYDLKKVKQKIEERKAQGKLFSIIVVAEGAKPIEGR